MIRLRRVIAGAMRHPVLGPLVLILLAFTLALLAIHGTADQGLDGTVVACFALAVLMALLVVLTSTPRLHRLDGRRPARAPPAGRPARRVEPAPFGLVALRL